MSCATPRTGHSQSKSSSASIRTQHNGRPRFADADTGRTSWKTASSLGGRCMKCVSMEGEFQRNFVRRVTQAIVPPIVGVPQPRKNLAPVFPALDPLFLFGTVLAQRALCSLGDGILGGMYHDPGAFRDTTHPWDRTCVATATADCLASADPRRKQFRPRVGILSHAEKRCARPGNRRFALASRRSSSFATPRYPRARPWSIRVR